MPRLLAFLLLAGVPCHAGTVRVPAAGPVPGSALPVQTLRGLNPNPLASSNPLEFNPLSVSALSSRPMDQGRFPDPVRDGAVQPASAKKSPDLAQPSPAGDDAAAEKASVEPAEAGDVPVFLEAARRGPSEESDRYVEEVLLRFDGLSTSRRGAVLAGLEDAAKAEPKAMPLRRALQDLIVRDELETIEPLLRRRALTPQRRDEVLAATSFKDIRWHHHFTNDIVPVPDGVTYPDNRILLSVRSGWTRLPSFIGHFRVLFAHEYTHRVENEGEFRRRFGAETAAVGTELLRGIELFGLEGLKGGMVRFIGEGVLGGFENGRGWLREGLAGSDGFFHKGFLAGAAYELALKTGRWADAWAFHRAVSSGTDPQAAARAISEVR